MNNKNTFQIAPAILEQKKSKIQEKLSIFQDVADIVQIDVVDGIFADKKTWPYTANFVEKIFSLYNLKHSFDNVELHLMVDDPLEFLHNYGVLSATELVVQIESKSAIDALSFAKKQFELKKIGISLMMGTDISDVEQYLNKVDYVQIMCIDKVGRQGSKFNPESINKVRELSSQFNGLISVDGAVSGKNIKELFLAGARRFAVGSHIFKSGSPIANYRYLNSLLEELIYPQV